MQLLTEPGDNAPETEAKKSRGLGSYVVCWFLVVMLYVLSSGPVQLLIQKRLLPRDVFWIYQPVGWLYEHTPLHKPLGMYLHLWDPLTFDTSGDEINVVY